jgi:branched-chain amino acid transport system substrate-binding protein
MKKNLWSLLTLLVLLSLFVACAPAAAPAPAEAPAAEAPAAEEPAAEAPAEEMAEEVEVIKVGGLYPLTGTDAINGENMKTGHDLAIREINDAGGIKCLGGAKLEMVYGDSQSKSEAGNAETERLITDEGVIAVMGAFHSHVVLPASEITEKYEVPFIIPNSLAGAITERGLKYVFQTIPTLEQWAFDDAKFAAENGAKTGVIAVMNIAFGEETQQAWEAGLPANGIEILDSISYQFGASDLSDTILKIKASDPDVLFLLANTADAILLTRQMQELDYYPKMGIINLGGGFADPSYIGTVGPDAAQGIFLTADWTPKINLPGAEEFATYFESEMGLLPTGAINTTYASTWLLADALEKACSTDPKKLAEVLRTTTFQPGEGTKWAFQWPEVSFQEDGKLEQARTVIAQWQNGEQVTVWPSELAVAEPIWPVPNWTER